MTDAELNEIENKAKEEQPASWYVLELIKEIRQLRKQLDWLANKIANVTDTNKGAWLEEAKELAND